MPPYPKPAPRVVDHDATKKKLLRDMVCRACHRPASSGHHLIPKGERGDDVPEGIVPLCGDGSTGCHGALHGSPYVVDRGAVLGTERRDAEWVRRRIGADLRPEELMYVGQKLGVQAGMDYLARNYYWRW